jgi:hypothetical protein
MASQHDSPFLTSQSQSESQRPAGSVIVHSGGFAALPGSLGYEKKGIISDPTTTRSIGFHRS